MYNVTSRANPLSVLNAFSQSNSQVINQAADPLGGSAGLLSSIVSLLGNTNGFSSSDLSGLSDNSNSASLNPDQFVSLDNSQSDSVTSTDTTTPTKNSANDQAALGRANSLVGQYSDLKAVIQDMASKPQAGAMGTAENGMKIINAADQGTNAHLQGGDGFATVNGGNVDLNGISTERFANATKLRDGSSVLVSQGDADALKQKFPGLSNAIDKLTSTAKTSNNQAHYSVLSVLNQLSKAQDDLTQSGQSSADLDDMIQTVAQGIGSPGAPTSSASTSSNTSASGSDSSASASEEPSSSGSDQSKKFQSPLELNLDGNGVGTSANKIQFDIEGTGTPSEINDIRQGAGVLTLNGGNSGKDLLGNNTDLGDGKHYKDGFAALRGLVEKAVKDGALSTDVLTSGKLKPNDLKVLEAQYGLGIKKDSLLNAATSLEDAGVSEIDLPSTDTAAQIVNNFDGRGNRTEKEKGAMFVRRDGTTSDYQDVWFKTA